MYIKTMENRKDLVKRIEQLAEEKAVYTRMPECAFVIGEFKVAKDGTLAMTEEADPEILETLLAEGMITEREEEIVAKKDAETDETSEKPEPIAVTVSVPMENHTADTLRNLVHMIRARGNLISKATGGFFSCADALVDAIADADDVPAFLSTLSEHSEELRGLEMAENKITFTGFPETADPERIQTFTELAALMNKMALEVKRVSPRPVCEDNERYIFRIWLLRLGMAGPDYATARRVLLSPLSGSMAFKDEAMETRFKEKQKAKRAAAKAAMKDTVQEAMEEAVEDTAQDDNQNADDTEEEGECE